RGGLRLLEQRVGPSDTLVVATTPPRPAFVQQAYTTAPAGGNAVSVTFSQPAAFVDLRVTEYSGLRTTAPFDAGTSASSAGTSASSGALTTAGPSELLFAAGMTGATFIAPGPGFTSRVVAAPDGDLVADAPAPTAGSYTATASLSSGTWLCSSRPSQGRAHEVRGHFRPSSVSLPAGPSPPGPSRPSAPKWPFPGTKFTSIRMPSRSSN